MAEKSNLCYEFGNFRADVAQGLLLCDGRLVPLKPKVFDTLAVLLARPGQVLGKEELLELVWPDAIVEENNLAQNISQLRRALGAEYIETIPKRGYRFIGEVRAVQAEPPAYVLTEYTATRILIDEAEQADEPAVVTLPAAATILPEPPAARLLAPASVQAGEEKSSQTLVPRPARLPRRLPRHLPRWLWLAAGGLAVVGALLAFRVWRKPSHAAVWRAATVTKLPNTGNSVRGALSPDGQFVAHVVRHGGQDELRLRHIASARDLQLAPPAPGTILQLAFTRDGGYVYFHRIEGLAKHLYKVSALGGPVTKLVENVRNGFALSPDGQRLAFIRQNAAHEWLLLLASAEGGHETVVLTHPETAPLASPAWSPDSSRIAFVGWEGPVQKDLRLRALELATRRESLLAPQAWRIVHGLEWLADGSGLLFAASGDKGMQLWLLPYPGDAARTLAQDLSNYEGISRTADGQLMLSPIQQIKSDLWLLDEAAPANARKITTGATSYREPVWTPDGRIVCASSASGHYNLWLLDADGGNARPLTTHAADDSAPAVAPDGRYVVFTSRRDDAASLWRVDLDGGNLRQLTQGRDDRNARFTPDGAWVIYTSIDGQRSTLWQVAAAGGAPVPLTREFTTTAAPAPDGRQLVYGLRETIQGPVRLLLQPYVAGAPLKPPSQSPSQSLALNSGPSSRFVWSPDSRALLYADDKFNIWRQPLAGGAPQMLTAFTEGNLRGFDLAPDGKRLVCARILYDNALVLLKPAE